jgi:hypothetical protein
MHVLMALEDMFLEAMFSEGPFRRLPDLTNSLYEDLPSHRLNHTTADVRPPLLS